MFKNIDSKHLKRYNVIVDEINESYTPREQKKVSWEKWFAWKPIRDIHGKRHWMTKVYRRKFSGPAPWHSEPRYEYGTIFDVLKDAE